jgi:hypothetical protein
MFIGSIPYHLLIANLYHLAGQGYTICMDSAFISTEVSEPNYPPEFIMDFKELV